MGDILRHYQKGEYKTQLNQSRKGDNLADEVRNTATLLLWWDKIPISELRWKKMTDYQEWRLLLENRRKGVKTVGFRCVDCDLKTLNNSFKFAIARDYFKLANPLIDKPRFCKAKHVHHCREFCSDNADQLHDVAEHFFKKPRSVAMGFQLLLEAYTGLRRKELRMWGTDKYGKLTPDGQYRYVWREKGQHAVNPYVFENEGLKAMMEALETWRKRDHPHSTAFLPNEWGKQISEDGLSRGLRNLSNKVDKKTGERLIERKITGHGGGGLFMSWYGGLGAKQIRRLPMNWGKPATVTQSAARTAAYRKTGGLKGLSSPGFPWTGSRRGSR